MTQHEQREEGLVAQRYDVDTLGTPFKVTLLDSVKFGIDPNTGNKTVQIPDLIGLIGAVIRSRVCHTRKLSGPELKYIRHALGVRANALAAFLDMSPEHLSRCEARAKVMSSTNEKILRLWAFLATFYKDPEELLAKRDDGNPELKATAMKPSEMAAEFMQMFLTMKIQSVFDARDELHFEFARRQRAVELDDLCNVLDSDDDGEWSTEPVLAAVNY